MTRRFNLVLLAIVLLLGVPYYWLMLGGVHDDVRAKPLEIAQLRALAAQMPGPRPSRIAMERSALHHLPGNLLAAGAGMKRRQVAVLSFRLDAPGQPPVLIDAGMTKDAANQAKMRSFDAVAQARIDSVARSAGIILATAETPEAMSRLASLAHEPLFRKARLLPEQLPPESLSRRLTWSATPPPPPLPPARKGQGPAKPYAVAPGVVAIPTGVPTPGAQMFFITMQDGREYLLAGGIAPLADNFLQMRTRSRFMTYFMEPEDRAESYGWLLALDRLRSQSPELRVIPGNDVEWLMSGERRSWIQWRFQPETGTRLRRNGSQVAGKSDTIPVRGAPSGHVAPDQAAGRTRS